MFTKRTLVIDQRDMYNNATFLFHTPKFYEANSLTFITHRTYKIKIICNMYNLILLEGGGGENIENNREEQEHTGQSS